MGPTSRLFEIIQLLRSSNRALPAHAIAETLGVAKRTVYRDIATLQGMRIPIEGEAGIGYVMRPGFDLPPLTFTQDEMEAISVVLAAWCELRQDWLKQNPAFAPDANTMSLPMTTLP